MGRLKRGQIKERFAMLPRRILESPEYQSLRPKTMHVLTCLAGQFNGHNNGRLTFTQKDGERFGIRRSGTRSHALRELEDARFILKTHQGGLRQYIPEATHWALPWQPLQYRDGRQLDVPLSAPDTQRQFSYGYGKRHAPSTGREPDGQTHQVRKAS